MTLVPNNCTSGDVRLVNGSSDSEGIVEVCYQGVWTTVAGIMEFCYNLTVLVQYWNKIFCHEVLLVDENLQRTG